MQPGGKGDRRHRDRKERRPGAEMTQPTLETGKQPTNGPTEGTIAVYLIGHLTEELKLLGDKFPGSIMKNAINFFYYLLPNFDNFNVKGKVVHGIYVSPNYMIMVTLYGFLYIGAVLLISGVIFQRRDFK